MRVVAIVGLQIAKCGQVRRSVSKSFSTMFEMRGGQGRYRQWNPLRRIMDGLALSYGLYQDIFADNHNNLYI